MYEWTCVKCGEKSYSAYDFRESRRLTCAVCGELNDNPHYTCGPDSCLNGQ